MAVPEAESSVFLGSGKGAQNGLGQLGEHGSDQDKTLDTLHLGRRVCVTRPGSECSQVLGSEPAMGPEARSSSMDATLGYPSA